MAWLPDLKQLRYFLHVAQSRSLTSASSRAHITQSALSRQIKLLEENLGVELFERRARGVRLTEAGSALLKGAVAILHDSEQLKESVKATTDELAGQIRLGLPQTLRPLLVAPLAAAFHREHPQVRFVLREGSFRGITKSLGDGELDLAFVSDLVALDPFAVEPLVSESLCLVGPKKAELSMEKSVTLRQLPAHDLILPGYPNSIRVLVDRALSAIGRSVEPVMDADQASMVLDLIRCGVGYAVLPYAAVHQFVARGLVSASPVKNLRINWVVAYSRERPLSRAAAAVVVDARRMCARNISRGVWKTGAVMRYPRDSAS